VYVQFIDLCILLGCDYCNSIKGVGPKRAIELMRQYKSLESIIENLDTKKYQIPEDWPYKEARRLFIEPEITDPESIEVIFFSYYFLLLVFDGCSLEYNKVINNLSYTM